MARTILSFLLILFSIQSFGWGVLGHRITGQIADSYLSKKAKREIKNLLGNESVAMASNWMDFIKSDSTFDFLGNWHYINIEGGLPADRLFQVLQNDTSSNIYVRINQLTNLLRSKAHTRETRAQYLKMLIHLVGDLHQPLHIGRKEDLGGNRVRVQWFNDKVNLHQVWDERLINFQQLSYTEYASAINFTTKEQRQTWQEQPVLNWIWESYQLAEAIYADIQPEAKLSYEYNYKFISPLNERLLKGGVRLAGLLNNIFD